MSAASSSYFALISRCEAAKSDDDIEEAIRAVATFIGLDAKALANIDDLLTFDAPNEAAIALLPSGAIWRRYIDTSASVYAASPYNAKAQIRYDGHSAIFSMALCAALLKMLLAPVLRDEAAAKRSAA